MLSSSISSTDARTTVFTHNLSAVQVNVGDHVSQNDVIGVLGHTGEGIDRERAHLHLELNLLINGEFEKWYSKYFPAEGNRHGIYNGQNLDGFDIGRFYLELAKNPTLTVPQFFQEETTWYKVRVAASKHMDLLRRYPWLSGAGWRRPPGKFLLTRLAFRFECRLLMVRLFNQSLHG